MIKIEEHFGVMVLRDDILPGGTKSVLMPSIIGEGSEYVYATPVYGGFQIALSAYCKSVGKQATIFCAKRGKMHPNTKKCLEYGAKVIEVEHGYLNVVESHAKKYCQDTGAIKLDFGAKSDANIAILADRVKSVIEKIGHEPKEIWCAIGSGALVEAILKGTTTAMVYGVIVGKEYEGKHERLITMKYHKPFDKECTMVAGFDSMPNYDLKAFEYCVKHSTTTDVTDKLFWNVL